MKPRVFMSCLQQNFLSQKYPTRLRPQTLKQAHSYMNTKGPTRRSGVTKVAQGCISISIRYLHWIEYYHRNKIMRAGTGK